MASRTKAAAAPKQLRITQVRSANGRVERHRATLRALGLRRHQQTVIQPDNPAIRGMIFKIQHMLKVEELPGGGS